MAGVQSMTLQAYSLVSMETRGKITFPGNEGNVGMEKKKVDEQETITWHKPSLPLHILL